MKNQGLTAERKLPQNRKCDQESPENLRYVRPETPNLRKNIKKNTHRGKRRRDRQKKEPRNTQTSPQDKPGTKKHVKSELPVLDESCSQLLK